MLPPPSKENEKGVPVEPTVVVCVFVLEEEEVKLKASGDGNEEKVKALGGGLIREEKGIVLEEGIEEKLKESGEGRETVMLLLSFFVIGAGKISSEGGPREGVVVAVVDAGEEKEKKLGIVLLLLLLFSTIALD